MKKISLIILALILLFLSCKDKNKVGKIKYYVEYTNQKLYKLKKKDSDTLYTQFGSYITSLTPYHFSASINMMHMQDSIDPTSNNNILLNFISAVGYMPEPQADFSNNQLVEFSPQLSHQYKVGQEINFKYFIFSVYYLYQEITLPDEYKNVVINQFNEKYRINWFGIGEEKYYCDSVKVGTVLKIKNIPFITRLHPYTAGYPQMYIFGNTDSTFIFNKEGNTIYNSRDLPIGTSNQGVNFCVMRSNKFQAITIKIPTSDETLAIKATVSFDTRNLIQVYTGIDNIPYTSDDIFVYAPKYWERIGFVID